MQTKSKIILVIVAIVIAAFLARAFLGKNPEPDTLQIQDELQAAAIAASNKDAPEVMSIISDNYTDDANDNPERLNILLRRGMSEANDLVVTVAPAKIIVSGDTATSASYISVKADGQTMFAQVVNLTWNKERTRRLLIIPDEAWRVVHSDFADGNEGG